MGLVRNLITKPAQESASASPPTGGIVVHDGRGRLRTAAADLAKAKDCITDLEARLNRLNTIITDADDAHAALQAAIAGDGGVALEAYGAGNASDQPIAKLVATKETTARAASAARDALPHVQDQLASARAQEAMLDTAKFDAVIVYLKMRASDEHKCYLRAFKDLCNSYDALCGIANALSATGHSAMLPTGLPVTLHVPGFNMGTGAAYGPPELVNDMTHLDEQAKIAHATTKWLAARERLLADAEANLDDLI